VVRPTVEDGCLEQHARVLHERLGDGVRSGRAENALRVVGNEEEG
jgi:hypothetical protein